MRPWFKALLHKHVKRLRAAIVASHHTRHRPIQACSDGISVSPTVVLCAYAGHNRLYSDLAQVSVIECVVG
jgi:hypothetical protein